MENYFTVEKFLVNPKGEVVTYLKTEDKVYFFTAIEPAFPMGDYKAYNMISKCGKMIAIGYFKNSDGSIENIDHVKTNDQYRRTWQA